MVYGPPRPAGAFGAARPPLALHLNTTSGFRAGSEEPFQDAATVMVQGARVWDLIAQLSRVGDENPVGAEATDVVLVVQREVSRPPVGDHLPLGRGAFAADAFDPHDHGHELPQRQLFLDELSGCRREL